VILGGFQKLTLIDYPGKLAATVFTVGCPFRCPFCHNPELVLNNKRHATCDMERIEKEFFEFLKKRKGKLEGVCITGGEPTIQPDLIEFIKKVKKIGYFVKLDTNGSRPDVLKKIIDGGLADYIAMDIKSSLENYDKASGVITDKERIKLSVNLIRNSGTAYEFRTTVVPGIHQEKDFIDISQWLKGSRAYYLQRYRETKILDPKLKRITKGKSLDLKKIMTLVTPYFDITGIRE
jgi:pyruvate formate lyase activating enzyme